MNNVITKSGLDKIDSSPLDYWWHYLNPDRLPYKADEKTIFDEAFRMAVLNSAEFHRKYVNQPPINKSSNIGKAEYESLINSVTVNEQILLSSSTAYPDKYNTILLMKAEVDKHPLCKLIFANGSAENYVEFSESESNACVKFKSHWIDNNNDLIVHLSSTSDASEAQFAKDSMNFNNHKRASIQLDGYEAIGEPKQAFLFINVERKAPFKISALYLDERSISVGRKIYLENCQTFMNCVHSGVWPGFNEKAVAVSLPDYYLKNY